MKYGNAGRSFTPSLKKNFAPRVFIAGIGFAGESRHSSVLWCAIEIVEL
ncbi:hypothetical protein [Burkholderia stabilis]|nr:hypothetical protein [Burkholderia stabilis]